VFKTTISVKLDPKTRINVDFKPVKKMKKRRELDALVNNGKIGRRKPTKMTKNGKHELLRSETDSSEVEFQVPAQKSAVIRK
jgi:hypothetical protein